MRCINPVVALPFLFTHAFFIFIKPLIRDKSYNAEITNGYGNGSYKAGDTVHIFSNSSNNLSFSHWKGDTPLLRTPEWHSWFIMPARDVKFSAVESVSANPDLVFETIRVQSTEKTVYYYFPDNLKGAVFLFHGSGGSAAQFSAGFESRYFIRELVNAGYGVIITECEEATARRDLNNDGHRRWNYLPVDSNRNPDIASIARIRSEFIRRGFLRQSTSLFAAGMSNGGAFSTILAPALEFKAAISFCAQAPVFSAIRKKMPVMFAMQAQDSHEAVGTNGNKKAYENSKALKAAGICTRYYQNPRSPLYPERFARHPQISLELSKQIFAELRDLGYLDEHNYLRISGREIAEKFRNDPRLFPVIRKLSKSQMLFVAEQADCAYADHRMFSELSKTAVKFLDEQCR